MSSSAQSTASNGKAGAHSWTVPASPWVARTNNPIRAVVETIQMPDPKKDGGLPMIPLSLGDPTVFGNLNPPETLVNAICKNAMSFKYNGYTNSSGLAIAKAAVAKFVATETSPLVGVCLGCQPPASLSPFPIGTGQPEQVGCGPTATDR